MGKLGNGFIRSWVLFKKEIAVLGGREPAVTPDLAKVFFTVWLGLGREKGRSVSVFSQQESSVSDLIQVSGDTAEGVGSKSGELRLNVRECVCVRVRERKK